MMNSAVTRMYSFGENINIDVVLLLAHLLKKVGLRLMDDLVSYSQVRISLNTVTSPLAPSPSFKYNFCIIRRK